MAKNSGRSFTYRERDKDTLKERANMRGGGFDSYIQPQFKKYKVREGKNLIRILPPTWDAARHYGYDIFVNYGIGPDNGQYLSLSKHNQGRDPIAEAQRKASRDGDEELARALSPRQRILMWIVDRMDEDEGPQLWDCPFTLDKKFCNLARDEDSNEVIFIDDPDKGCDIRFYREGTGLSTDYDSKPAKLMGRSPLSDDDAKATEWLEYIQDHPVPSTLKFYDADYLDEVFSGQKPSKGKPADDDVERSTPKRRASTPKVVEDDDEPTPKRARPAAKAAIPEDDDEAPFDEDEPAPPPKKGESLRERLERRRAAAAAETEDEDD